MIIIGLTGSMAMGKSEVTKIMSSQHIPAFDADREVHDLYDSRAGVELLAPHVPSAIVTGKIDRSRLTAAILADPELLERLETLVHAEIAKRRDAFIDAAKAQGQSIVVLDIPLLFEKNLDRTVTHTVVVSASPATQQQRALARPGMTLEKFEMIRARQMPDAEKRSRADYIIENNGSLEDLRKNTLDVLSAIKKDHSL